MKLSFVVLVGLLLMAPCVKSQQQSVFTINTVQELRQFFYGQHVKYPLISAHRGGPGVGYPENAMETFRNTASKGAFIIEFDVALSKDSALVLMHDNTLDRTTTGNGAISAKTYDELQKIKLKDKAGNETNFKIPLLEEALEWGKGKAIFTIDVKRGVPFSKIIAAVRQKQAEPYSVIITYNANQAAEVHQLAPDLMISASIRSKEDLDRLNNAGVPDSCLVAFVGTSEPDSAVYQILAERGITAMMGTMGNLDRQAVARGAEVYYNLVKRGANALSTDAPEVANAAIGKLIEEQQITSPFVRRKRVQTPREEVDTSQQIETGRINSAEAKKKPYVILISLDGFRHDYVEKHGAPFINSVVAKGVKASSLIPSFPSVTFPNHYTVVTGMYPSRHGLTANSFYDAARKETYTMGNKDAVRDGSWYGGTPLWVLAEQHKTLSASMFWVGSEADVQGVRPTYSYNYTEKIPIENRLEIVKNWLQLPDDERPHLITFYLNEPDHVGHRHGPLAAETKAAVAMVDSVMFKLDSMVKTTGLPVNFVLVSDHGMTTVDKENYLSMPEEVDRNEVIIPYMSTMASIHVKDSTKILPLFKTLQSKQKGYSAYLEKDVPDYLHYRAKEKGTKRIGDIILLPEYPLLFSNRTPGEGYHGFDPYKVKDMHGIFYAWGPAFKKGLSIQSFENVHIYPMIADLLGLSFSPSSIDGDAKVLKVVLKK